jgi:hypothetical protein
MDAEAVAAIAVASLVGAVLLTYAAVLLKMACCRGAPAPSIESEALV